jgi:ubiquitin C-terminal hydrolase
LLDISLSIDGCSNLILCLDKYCKQEILSGENIYDTGIAEFGKQVRFIFTLLILILKVALKSVKFASLPPVLQIHLKRFTVSSSKSLKLNDRVEFPEVLDLGISCTLDYSNFAGKYSRNEGTELYRLQSVIVHSGLSCGNGHYVTYVNPNLEGDWFLFDDQLVKKVHWFWF